VIFSSTTSDVLDNAQQDAFSALYRGWWRLGGCTCRHGDGIRLALVRATHRQRRLVQRAPAGPAGAGRSGKSRSCYRRASSSGPSTCTAAARCERGTEPPPSGPSPASRDPGRKLRVIRLSPA